ncbi:hypothetical protein [Aeromicrobium sp. IC_218]|uniref:hypothetical protein n=1 Tax=Aeromicrobium sp. IC_218 TaxID=2545468 RepID=UPI00103DB2BD|nr:hypothetical protein [Aeromicrobium sp. IC_218]TCI98822.1 hypothetical protein E0W78_08695 [Aeromicrobium sp. IC_218]
MPTEAPWVRSRGLGRLIAQETNVSDLLQFLTDLDPTPWSSLIGFVPAAALREARGVNNADLLLVSDDGSRAVVEVKLGHLMSRKQQEAYEGLRPRPALYLAALSADAIRITSPSSERWGFLSLINIFSAFSRMDSDFGRSLATQVSETLGQWDSDVAAVFEDPATPEFKPLNVLNQKFLARVVTRRIAANLDGPSRCVRAGVTIGGGLTLVQAWTPVRDATLTRSFMAEVRWRETKADGELRFGVDFEPEEGEAEDRQLRTAAYDLALSMDDVIDFSPLRQHLSAVEPRIAGLLAREGRSRPTAKGQWDRVIKFGFAGAPLDGNKKNNRQRTSPAFFGDGALRYQAIAEIDFSRAGAGDVARLLDATLSYLSESQP